MVGFMKPPARPVWVEGDLAYIAQEIERLKHEQSLVERLDENPSPDDAATLDAAIETARAALARMRGAAR
jgi:hypothetical protein